ncbi:hypothetical protein ACOSHH_000841 [Klebsiella aerogenes]
MDAYALTKMSIASYHLIISSVLFVAVFVTLIIYHGFYKKHDQELAGAFELLRQNGFLDYQDCYLYGKLGLPGFGFRTSLMAAILKKKKIKRKGGGWLKSGASQLVREYYGISWIQNFQRLTWLMLFLFTVMFILALLGDN